MQDSVLLKAALVTSTVGLIALFFLSSASELDESSLGGVDGMDQFEEVFVEGTATQVHKTGNVTIIRLTEFVEVKAVVFDEVNVSEGQLIQVYGSVKEYEGEKEITADRIRVVG